MKVLSKAMAKTLHRRMVPISHLIYNSDISQPEYFMITTLERKIPQWYRDYNISCNDRRQVIDIHKKKFGPNTYTFVGNVKHTNWIVESSTCMRMMIDDSTRGTGLNLENIIQPTDIATVLQELCDYLYDHNAWYGK